LLASILVVEKLHSLAVFHKYMWCCGSGLSRSFDVADPWHETSCQLCCIWQMTLNHIQFWVTVKPRLFVWKGWEL